MTQSIGQNGNPTNRQLLGLGELPFLFGDTSSTMVIGTDFETEADVWRIATGWGDDEEIEQRKREGWRAVRAVVIV